jgi:single-stranded-DNA-specific exonuclease
VGLSLRKENYAQFALLFDQAVKAELSEADFKEVLLSDGELDANDCTIETARLIEQAGPWGQQFPEPVFDGEFFIVQQRIVGEKHLKLVLALDAAAQQTIDAIAFNVDLQEWPNTQATQVKVAYQLAVNVFRGQESAQLMVRHITAL